MGVTPIYRSVENYRSIVLISEMLIWCFHFFRDNRP